MKGKTMSEITSLFIDGFIEKCAEYGVDPEALLKHAQELPNQSSPTYLENMRTALQGLGLADQPTQLQEYFGYPKKTDPTLINVPKIRDQIAAFIKSKTPVAQPQA